MFSLRNVYVHTTKCTNVQLLREKISVLDFWRTSFLLESIYSRIS